MGEDLLILSLALLAIAFPVATIYLLIQVASLSRRLRHLEAALAEGASGTPTGQGAEIAPTSSTAPDPGDAQPKSTAGPWARSAEPGPAWPTRSASAAPPPDLRGPDWAARAVDWLAANWFYLVAAASLALAGIFLIQYGVERGLLPPPLRVAAAAAFGIALIAGGEWVRRRWGDGLDAASAYLPSVFSGAGIVTLFAALLGARHLYGLIGPGLSLTGLAVVALSAIVLGWFHGPLLVAVGLIGGAVAPFVVGGGGSDLTPLHGYFALLGVVGLAVDAVRRWPFRWVSLLALACAMGGSSVLVLEAPETTVAYLLAVVGLTLVALALPVRRLWPDHRGAMLSEALLVRRRGRLMRPATGVAALAVAGAAGILVMASVDAFWWSVCGAVLLVAALTIWARAARALQDLTVLPALGILAMIAGGRAGSAMDVTWMLACGAVISMLAAWRANGRRRSTYRLGWTLAAVLAAPAAGLVLHLQWRAPEVVGLWLWSLHAMAVAAGLTAIAGVWARQDGEDRLRTSLAALLAFTVIGYGIGLIAGDAALTLAIAGMAALAAGLDRAFRLPALTWFTAAAVPFTGWRLMIEPGWVWGLDGPLLQVVMAFAGAVIGFAAAWALLRGQGRQTAEVLSETAMLSFAGLAAILMLWRGATAMDLSTPHLVTGLTACIWLLLGWIQLQRARRLQALRLLRQGLGWVFAGLGALFLLGVLTVMNPVFANLFPGVVRGPVIVNSLIPAFLLPGLLLMLYPYRIARICGAAVAGVWLVLAIRHFWNGSAGMALSQGASQPEITSYTLALLLFGGGMFYHGLAARAPVWRRAGVAMLGLTAAKVFAVDAASLTGLLRVGAFAALAFCLAGLAWLNRWAGMPPITGNSNDGGGDPSGGAADASGDQSDAGEVGRGP